MALIRKMRVGDQIQTTCGTILRVVEVRGKVVRIAVEHPRDEQHRLTEAPETGEDTAEQPESR